MEELDLKQISKAASEKLGEPVDFVSSERVGTGFHSVGYKLATKEGKAYFIKKIAIDNFGFEFPERKLSSMMVGHSMAVRSNATPRPIAVLLENNKTIVSAPELNDASAVYHLQEFEPEGSNYFALLKERTSKNSPDDADRVEIRSIVDLIAGVHAIKPDVTDPVRRGAMYRDSLRTMLTHPEWSLTFLHEYDEKHPFLPPSKQGEYIGLYLDLMHYWKGHHEHLSALHGDFWGGNVFIRRNHSAWLIDYSRIPWGEPGVDIGNWMGGYVWHYHTSPNPQYFKELGELFLTLYEQKTGDTQIRKALALGFFFPSFILAFNSPETPVELRIKMFEHGKEILKRGEFFWPQA